MIITEFQANTMMDTICEYISRTCGTFAQDRYSKKMYDVIVSATRQTFIEICNILDIQEIEED